MELDKLLLDKEEMQVLQELELGLVKPMQDKVETLMPKELELEMQMLILVKEAMPVLLV